MTMQGELAEDRDTRMAEGQAESDGSRRKGLVRRFGPLALIAVAIAAFFALDLDRFVSFSALSENRDALKAFVADNHVGAVAIFILAYTAATALSLPGGAILTVTGGFLFGNVFGTLWAVVAATAGATLVFLAARTALGDFLRDKAGSAVRRLEEGFRDNAFNYLLFLRLVPAFPFFVINLVPAFLGVPLRTYVAATLIGIIPGTFVFAQVGEGLDSVFAAGGKPDLGNVLTLDIALALTGLAVLALLPIAVKKIRGRKAPSPADDA